MLTSTAATTLLPASGSYSVPEAARLVRLPQQRARRYAREYPTPDQPERGAHGRRGYSLSFLDLMELRVVGKFHEVGLPWPKICAVARGAAEWLDYTRYPLSHRNFLANGAEMLTHDHTTLKTLTRHGWHTVAELMTPLDYDAGGHPVRWLISLELNLDDAHAAIIVDPNYSFGSPVLQNSRVPTGILYQTWLAENRNDRTVAKAYRITEDELRAACRFEEYLSD